MDPRVTEALTRYYPDGIPKLSIADALRMAESVATALGYAPTTPIRAPSVPKPVAEAAAPKRKRGRPPKVRPVEPPPARVERTEDQIAKSRVRALLETGPATVEELGAPLEIIIAAGARPVGARDDGTGQTVRTYGLVQPPAH